MRGGGLQNQRKPYIILTNMKRCTRRQFRKKSSSRMLITLIKHRKITNIIPNDYIFKYSAAVAPMYITKYLSKTFHKSNIHSKAVINFFCRHTSEDRLTEGDRLTDESAFLTNVFESRHHINEYLIWFFFKHY